MLIYGESFLQSNAEALAKLKDFMGERAYAVAIEMAPDLSEDEEEEEPNERDHGKLYQPE